MGDIKVGDYVFDRYGQPTQVLGVFPQGELDCYWVGLADGRSTKCHANHIFTCYDTRNRLVDVTVNDIMRKPDNYYSVPNLTKPIVYDKPTHLPISAYAIGYVLRQLNRNSSLLKDDFVCISENPKIYMSREELFRHFPELKECGIIDEKYLRSSIEDRRALIKGIMGNKTKIKTTNPDLANLVYDILMSLGYSANLGAEPTNVWVISYKRQYMKTKITRVYPMGKTEMVCLYVDNLEHLYLTNDYIVTHNTTLVKHIIAALQVPQERVVYAAYTGKAAKVLKQMGNPNTMTLHKLLFEWKYYEGKLHPIPRTELPEYDIVVVDEISMVTQEFVNLLLKIPNIYILFLGDPGQLKQIGGHQNVLMDSPHIFLDQIMRQALDNEIIKFSMDVREGHPLPEYYKGKDVQVYPHDQLTDGMLKWADQIICATNKTRVAINNHMRQLYGFSGDPQKGDKVICLKNDWETFDSDGNPLVNGTIGTLRNSPELRYKYLHKWVSIPPEKHKIPYYKVAINTDEDTEFAPLDADAQLFTQPEPWLDDYESNIVANTKKAGATLPHEFTYAYAVSCHKAQGSQWNKVLIIEEDFPFNREEHKRWLYTSLTRAASKAVIIRK